MTGSRTTPLNNPNTTVRVNTLKKVRKTWPVDREHSTSARKVVNPPLRTAGPMESTASTVLQVLHFLLAVSILVSCLHLSCLPP